MNKNTLLLLALLAIPSGLFAQGLTTQYSVPRLNFDLKRSTMNLMEAQEFLYSSTPTLTNDRALTSRQYVNERTANSTAAVTANMEYYTDQAEAEANAFTENVRYWNRVSTTPAESISPQVLYFKLTNGGPLAGGTSNYLLTTSSNIYQVIFSSTDNTSATEILFATFHSSMSGVTITKLGAGAITAYFGRELYYTCNFYGKLYKSDGATDTEICTSVLYVSTWVSGGFGPTIVLPFTNPSDLTFATGEYLKINIYAQKRGSYTFHPSVALGGINQTRFEFNASLSAIDASTYKITQKNPADSVELSSTTFIGTARYDTEPVFTDPKDLIDKKYADDLIGVSSTAATAYAIMTSTDDAAYKISIATGVFEAAIYSTTFTDAGGDFYFTNSGFGSRFNIWQEQYTTNLWARDGSLRVRSYTGITDHYIGSNGNNETYTRWYAPDYATYMQIGYGGGRFQMCGNAADFNVCNSTLTADGIVASSVVVKGTLEFPDGTQMITTEETSSCYVEFVDTGAVNLVGLCHSISFPEDVKLKAIRYGLYGATNTYTHGSATIIISTENAAGLCAVPITLSAADSNGSYSPTNVIGQTISAGTSINFLVTAQATIYKIRVNIDVLVKP